MSEPTTEKSEVTPTPVTTDSPKESKGETPQPTERKTYLSIVRASPIYVDASKLFHWRDPVKSGLVFGMANLFYYELYFEDYTLMTLLSYILLALLVISFGFVQYVVLKARYLQGRNVDNPFKARFKNSTFHVSRNTIVQHVDTVLDLMNLTIDLVREVYYCTNLSLTLQAAFFLYCVSTVGGWFSGLTLMYLVTLGFFVWPRLYEEKQQEINQIYGQVYTVVSAQLDTAVKVGLSKVPPVVFEKFPFLKPKSA